MQLVFEQIRAGGDRNFGYLLGDRDAKRAVLIDPSYSPEAFVARAAEQGLIVSHVINTHGHPDHVNGNARAVEMTQAVVAAHPLLRPGLPLQDGQTLTIGSLTLRCTYVPGPLRRPHRALRSEPSPADHRRSAVRRQSRWHIVRQRCPHRVGKLAASRVGDPRRCDRVAGHDYGARPSSTMALEKSTNPFLMCRSETEFLQLKANWASFKKQHGLR